MTEEQSYAEPRVLDFIGMLAYTDFVDRDDHRQLPIRELVGLLFAKNPQDETCEEHDFFDALAASILRALGDDTYMFARRAGIGSVLREGISQDGFERADDRIGRMGYDPDEEGADHPLPQLDVLLPIDYRAYCNLLNIQEACGEPSPYGEVADEVREVITAYADKAAEANSELLYPAEDEDD